jgi:membrane-associated PAP2 superfamily phosphatase
VVFSTEKEVTTMRPLTITLLVLALLLIQILPALASHECPSPSRGFGEHIALVTPEHPLEHGGRHFGD